MSATTLDPLRLFGFWFDEAVAGGVPEPEAVALATASADGAPSARMVLYRGMSGAGLTFYTNYESRKGGELAANPRAAMLFYWRELGRQVRVEGRVEKLPPAESDAYFASRPRGHRIGALASPQSRPITGRDELLARRTELEREHEGRDQIPRPDWWGGFRLIPDAIELWTNGADRLHHRVLYRRQADGTWSETILGP